VAHKWVTGIVIVCALGSAGCTASKRLAEVVIPGKAYMVKADAPTAGPPPDKALVYVLRPSGGPGVNRPFNSFQVWDRDQFIGLNQPKSYFAYLCAPGRHLPDAGGWAVIPPGRGSHDWVF
jgi:hypothetical protein